MKNRYWEFLLILITLLILPFDGICDLLDWVDSFEDEKNPLHHPDEPQERVIN